MSTVPSDRYMVFVGNSGSGKSWLFNQMLGQEVFKSDISVDGITTSLESISISDPDNDASVIHFLNIPGLVEAKKAHIERNTRVLQEALSKGGYYKLVFVFGAGNGGRLLSRDVFAYKEFCKGYNLHGLPVVVNNLFVDVKPGEDKATKLHTYSAMVKAALKESDISADFQVIEHDASPDEVLKRVFFATEKFPWHVMAVAEAPVVPMNFDERSQAVEEAMAKYEEEYDALMRQLHEQEDLMEELVNEARQREQARRQEYERRLAGAAAIMPVVLTSCSHPERGPVLFFLRHLRPPSSPPSPHSLTPML